MARAPRASRAERAAPPSMTPLAPRKKWRAVTIATLLLVPAYWFILAGAVSAATEGRRPEPAAGPLLAAGLCLIPFVFVALAFLSEHPRAPGAAVKAMGLALLIGAPVSALVPDAVTGFVAGVGAGGIAAMRMDVRHTWRSRTIGVLVSVAWVFVTVHVVPEAALLLAPILPFTSIAVADDLRERRLEQAA